MTTTPLETHRYRHLPHRGGAFPGTIVALHGTGGNEADLLPLAEQIAARAAVLSPRGNVLEHGMPRFFRRLAEGVFDVPDLIARTHALADFIAAAREHHRLPNPVIAMGYSNGANIAGALLLLRPEVLDGAMLLRPMLPLEPASVPALEGKRVLLASGTHDPICPPESAARLGDLLREGGAVVTEANPEASHGLVPEDVSAMRAFIAMYR